MRLSCLHTHTFFCDGHADVEDFCSEAFRKGFASLGFSSHAPIPLASEWHLRLERLDEYLSDIRGAAERWSGRLDVLAGLEVDYIAGLGAEDGTDGFFGPSCRRFSDLPLDYVIGSVHYLSPAGSERFTVDGPAEEWERGVSDGYGGDAEAAAEAYWEAVAAMVRAGGFDIVGHLDLVKKNNRGTRVFDEDGHRYAAAAEAALDSIADRKDSIFVEINTGGMNRGSIAEPYPSLRLLRALRDRDVRMTVNADAHRPEHLDGHYDEARRSLLAAGFECAWIRDGNGWTEESL